MSTYHIKTLNTQQISNPIGTIAINSNIDFGSNTIVNVSTINGVDVVALQSQVATLQNEIILLLAAQRPTLPQVI